MQWHLEIIGVQLIVLALLHIAFPRYFNWRNELQAVSLITRQILHVHTFFIALTVFLMGLLCLTSSRELTTTVLGRRIALGFFIFWSCRLFLQFFGYSSQLWKGKPFETSIHIAFSVLWTYFSAVFLLAFIG
ncbi:MAG TPA: hypothetical protein VF258_09875 [Luteolibacter sp.]